LLNPNSRHELDMRGVLAQAAVPNLANQAAIFKVDIYTGARRKIARADEAQAAFRDIRRAARSSFYSRSADCADLDCQIGGVARVAALFESVHKLIVGCVSNYLDSSFNRPNRSGT
jgi:hypothetical protein